MSDGEKKRHEFVDDWLAAACADAARRGLPDLAPLLASLAEATKALRDAGWEAAPDRAGGAGAPQ